MSRAHKPVLLSFFISVILSASLYAQDESLVGYYPFNGNANDHTLFENHGSVLGAELAADRFGNQNSAYYFDGSGYIDFGDNEINEFDKSDFAISVWIQAGYAGQEQYQILRKGLDFRTSGEGRWVISLDEEGRLRIILEDAEQGFDLLRVNGTTSLLDGRWHHLAVVFDRDSLLSAFIDNQLEVTSEEIRDFQGNISNQEEVSMYAGRPNNPTSRFFMIGKIDDIRIYSKTLNQNEINSLYSQGGWEGYPEVEADTLVAHYPFDGDAADVSGFASNGYINGAEPAEDRFGNQNSAYQFDGNDYVDISHHPVLNAEAKTIQFWFQKTNDFINDTPGLNDVEGLFWKSTDTGSNRAFSFSLSGQSSPFSFYLKMGNRSEELQHAGTYEQIVPGRWYQAVAVIEPGSISIYVNGELVNAMHYEGEALNNTSPMTIGRASLDSYSTRYFTGKIDDIRIYNYALDEEAIRTLYTEGGWPLDGDTAPEKMEELIGYYPFSGNAKDHTPYNNAGVNYGANLSTDRFEVMNHAYEFDGLNDYILLQAPTLYFSRHDFSVTFWAQGISSDTDFKGMITTPDNTPFGISIDDGDRFRFSVQYNEQTIDLTAENLQTDAGEWYRYSVVFKGGEYLRIFRNGKQVASLDESVPDSLDLNTGASGIYLGTLQRFTSEDIPDNYFQGSIDEVKIFNYPLEASEIEDLYREEKGTISSTSDQDSEIPQQIRLYQNYPNPFNPTTHIKYEIPRAAEVSLKVYDLTGRVVATLAEGYQRAGVHTVVFEASDLASGVYVYELSTPDFTTVKKLTLIK